MNLKQTAMALRFWADTVHFGIEHALDPGDDSAHASERRDVVLPTASGAGIVIGISLLERLAMDKLAEINGTPPQPLDGMTDLRWVNDLGLSLSSETRSELECFIRLRHCFAHEYGRVTARNEDYLRNYLADLSAERVKDNKGNVITPYFDIDSEKQIWLSNEARNRLRLTLWEVLKEIDRN